MLLCTAALVVIGCWFYIKYRGDTMETLSKAASAVKDFYLRAADWVALHPHWTIWIGGSALVVALVF